MLSDSIYQIKLIPIDRGDIGDHECIKISRGADEINNQSIPISLYTNIFTNNNYMWIQMS